MRYDGIHQVKTGGIIMATHRATIKDVAREAGVSISTVSNAVNNVDVLLPETKQRVLEIAERLHYVPNLTGRNLKVGKTMVIGLYLNSMRGAYYGALADSVYSACKKNGYDLQIYVGERKQYVMSGILGRQNDGVIIHNKQIDDASASQIGEEEIPAVFIDRKIHGPHMSSVIFDSYHEGMLAAKYLVDAGNKSFMFVQGPEYNFDGGERQRGFCDGLDEAGINGNVAVLHGEFERDAAYQALTEYIARKRPIPDAIFAANDLSAIGVCDALRNAGIDVPGRVNVIGCDDIEAAGLVNPALTTIRTSFEIQGKCAVESLMKLMDGKQGDVDTLKGSIIERGTTCIRK